MASPNTWKCASCGAPNPQSNEKCYNCKSVAPSQQTQTMWVPPVVPPPVHPYMLAAIQRRFRPRYPDILTTLRFFGTLAWIGLAICIIGFVGGMIDLMNRYSSVSVQVQAGSLAGASLILGIGCVHTILLCQGLFVLLCVEENTKNAAETATSVTNASQPQSTQSP